MLITISSGSGVDEVCRAIWHFVAWLEVRYDFTMVQCEYARCEEGYRSVVLKSNDERLRTLEGTHLWRCQSPFRPKHKRKNWYFTLQINDEDNKRIHIDESKIIYQTMKSPKKGGQHVNTTSSGVRARYVPLGIEALSYDERSQHRNKIIAKERLLLKIEAYYTLQAEAKKQKQWQEGKVLERGNAVKVFEGEYFKEVCR